MKYKKHITTGALALSLLIGGTTAFAEMPQDKTVQSGSTSFEARLHPKLKQVLKHKKELKGRQAIGTVTALSSSGFTLETKNLKTKAVTSIDVKTLSTTTYSKDGATASFTDIAIGQKIIVRGEVDSTSHVVTASKVKIITKIPTVRHSKFNKKVVTPN